MFSYGYKFFLKIVYCLQNLLPDLKKNVKQKISHLEEFWGLYEASVLIFLDYFNLSSLSKVQQNLREPVP